MINSTRELSGLAGSFEDVKQLMESAFPVKEQMPFFLLRLMALRSGISFRAYYENGVLAGFAYTEETERTMFLLFLAVSEELRGKGYGSAVLDDLKRRAGNKCIVLNIEPAADDVPDAAERKNRLAFYRWNGFEDTGWKIRDKNDTYQILAHPFLSSLAFDVQDYRKAVGRLTFGMYQPYVFRDRPAGS